MLNYGADTNAVDGMGCTALHLAAKGGHVDVMELLLSHDADINAPDVLGWNALHHAAENDCDVVVQFLITRVPT